MSREFRARGAKKQTQAQLDEALHAACQANNKQNVLAHLEAGANIEAERVNQYGYKTGRRPLFTAVASNNIGIATLLADRGADLRGCVDGRPTTLHEAVGRRLPQMVTFLAERGFDMNVRTSWGIPLLSPAFSAEQPMCLLLVSFGADPAIEDNNHRSALTHYGIYTFHQPLAPAVKAARVAELVAARAEYVERARRQANWNRRRSAMLFLQGSGFRPSETQLAAQHLEQQQVDKHAHIKPTVLADKEARLAHLVSKVLGMEGLSRNVVSFL